MTKPCIECGKEKPHSEFYRHPGMRDGTRNVCKPCHKARTRRRRLVNPKVQEHDRARSQRPERKASNRANVARWQRRYPLGYRAHYTVRSAIRRGRLVKEPCTMCGTTERVHAHHKDYAKPLDVTWLCAKCHRRIHAAFPELNGHRNAPAVPTQEARGARGAAT
jgi:hypothetical protein